MRAWLGLIVCSGAVAAFPAAALAGSISGTVTAEGSGTPIAGVEVCPQPKPYTFEAGCAETDGSGHYSLTGLRAAEYTLHFSGWRNNLEYVDEFYDNRESFEGAETVAVGASQNLVVDAQLARGGSIAGKVTDEGTGDPIGGIEACAVGAGGIPGRCVLSDASGQYRINGLRSGEYRVEFEGGNRANYLTEFYKDAKTWGEAQKVSVTAPEAVSGIDQALAPGAQILGRVTEAGSGAPYAGITVCAEAQVGEFEDCETTGSSGEYALRSLPAGEYLVGFGIEYLPSGRHAAQWWQGVSSKVEATPIAIAPPETRAGIDAQLVNPFPPEVITVTISPAPSPVPQGPKCRKGFHRKKVKGKLRCVRKKRHKHHHRRHRHHHHHGVARPQHRAARAR